MHPVRTELPSRFNTTARILHWLMALMILAMLFIRCGDDGFGQSPALAHQPAPAAWYCNSIAGNTAFIQLSAFALSGVSSACLCAALAGPNCQRLACAVVRPDADVTPYWLVYAFGWGVPHYINQGIQFATCYACQSCALRLAAGQPRQSGLADVCSDTGPSGGCTDTCMDSS